MDKIMSDTTVGGHNVGRISDASSPELLPAEVALDMPEQDEAVRGVTSCDEVRGPVEVTRACRRARDEHPAHGDNRDSTK